MKRKKQALCVLMLASLLFGNILIINRGEVRAASNIQVILDGMLQQFDVPPQIINNRTMVPFRAIGEAMGANVSWDDAQKKVTMLLHSKYVILFVNNSVMTYGDYSTDSNGQTVFETISSYGLDAPPTIVDSRTLVPVRAISEGLGAQVSWDGVTSLVTIVSPYTQSFSQSPIPSPSPSPSPSPISTPTEYPFGSSSFFEEISGRRAQAKYDENEKFVLVYYSSNNDQDSAELLPLVKEVAKIIGYKIYGVDVDSREFDNTSASNRVNFIWNFVSIGNMKYPAVFYVNGKNDVSYQIRPTSQRSIEDWMYDFFFRKSTPGPTSSPTYTNPTPTPLPTATPTQNINAKWIDIYSIESANNFYNSGKFILVYYWKNDTDSEKLLNDIIKPAAIDADVYVYGLNASAIGSEKDTRSWWARTAYNSLNSNYPTIFLVESNKSVSYILKNDITYSNIARSFNAWKAR